jgi:hypothetical protein
LATKYNKSQRGKCKQIVNVVGLDRDFVLGREPDSTRMESLIYMVVMPCCPKSLAFELPSSVRCQSFKTHDSSLCAPLHLIAGATRLFPS